MKKLLKWGLALVFVVVIIAALIVYFPINKIVAGQIKTFAEENLNAEVNLDTARVSFFPVGLVVNKLSIKNLGDREPWRQFNVDKINVNIDHNTIFSDTIVINYLIINSPQVTYDVGKLGLVDVGKQVVGSIIGNALLGPVGIGVGVINRGIGAIKKKVGSEGDGGQKRRSKPRRVSSGKNFIIKKLYINGGKFIPDGEVLWLGKKSKVPLPDIELEYVDETSGKNILKHVKDIVRQAVIKKLLQIKGGGKSIILDKKRKIGKNLKKIGAQIGENVTQVKEQIGENMSQVGSQIGENVTQVKEKIGSKLGNNVKQVGSKIGKNVKNVGSKVGENVSKVGKNVKQVGSKVGKNVTQVGSKVGKNVTQVFCRFLC